MLEFCDPDKKAGLNEAKLAEYQGILARHPTGRSLDHQETSYIEPLYSDERAGYWSCVHLFTDFQKWDGEASPLYGCKYMFKRRT